MITESELTSNKLSSQNLISFFAFPLQFYLQICGQIKMLNNSVFVYNSEDF